MRDELDKELCEKYPKIFKQRNWSMQQTLMCWGFEHQDGWYNIIDALCFNIQSHVKWTRKQRANALREARKLKKDISTVPEACPQVVAVQVKEKFGGLRFYYDGGDEQIRAMVDMAESMSIRTCEVCGSPGHQRSGGWIQTLCDTHAKKDKREN